MHSGNSDSELKKSCTSRALAKVALQNNRSHSDKGPTRSTYSSSSSKNSNSSQRKTSTTTKTTSSPPLNEDLVKYFHDSIHQLERHKKKTKKKKTSKKVLKHYLKDHSSNANDLTESSSSSSSSSLSSVNKKSCSKSNNNNNTTTTDNPKSIKKDYNTDKDKHHHKSIKSFTHKALTKLFSSLSSKPKPTTKMHPKKLITSAPPPLHSILFVFITASLCLYHTFISSSCLDTIDEVATFDTFGTSLVLFRDGGEEGEEARKLGWARLCIGMFIFGVSIYQILFGGWEQLTNYLPNSKLTAEPLQMKGLYTLAPFTTWSWNILGCSFALNGLLALYVGYGYHLENNTDNVNMLVKAIQSSPKFRQYLLRTALLLFEIAAPCTILVSAVIRYAIWPKALAASSPNNPDPTKGLKVIPILLQHNANVVLAFVEIGLLGGVPVRYCDFAVAPLFGLVYVLFSWCMMNRWRVGTTTTTTRKGGCPQFLYFFLDTTLGKTSTICLVVLFFVLMCSYGVFSVADHVFGRLVDVVVGGGGGGEKGGSGGGVFEVVVRLVMVLGTCSIFCRFRD